MNFGIVQIALANDVHSNLKKICSYIDEAAMAKVDILCFPECSLTGYKRDFHKLNQDEITRALKTLRDIAVENQLTTIIGTPYFESGKLYNAAFVISSDSQLKYFKNNLTEFDKQYFIRGRQTLTFEVKGVKCGLAICRDQNHPAIFQNYKQEGVRIVFLPSAHYYLPEETRLKRDKNKALPIVRALDNKIYVAKANAVGSQGNYINLGHSIIVNPDGYIISEADDKEEKLLYYEL